MRNYQKLAYLAAASASAMAFSNVAHAQDGVDGSESAEVDETDPAPGAVSRTGPNTGFNEIVVTAQKRAQSINDVGLSITAASGEFLAERGVTDVAGLTAVVPGLVYTPSPYATPVYTLRGVGYYDNALAGSPTVSVYVDEVSLPFPVMTPGATLDVERVEVLKGPQGTLYGQNATGGAINYVSAKPTDTTQAGIDIGYSRFDTFEVNGFVSGPLTDTLRVRAAGRAVEGGPWQKSYTRDDELGRTRKFFGRVLFDWTPSATGCPSS